MRRRQFVLGGLSAGLGAGALPALARPPVKTAPRAAIPFGAAMRVDLLRDDPDYRRAVLEHCQVLVGEGGLKWFDLRPAADRFVFDHPDRLLAFADAHGLQMRGHTLAWYAGMPKWTEAITTKQAAERALYEHIDTVVGRYKGRIPSWDVVNEAISDNPAIDKPMRSSLWQDLLGTQHIDMAFRRTAAVDPKVQLVLNDFGFENPTGQCRAKRTAFLRLVKELKDRGTPLHAIGLQGHLPGEKEIDREGLSRFVSELHGMGLAILVTELDVIDDKLPPDPAIRDEIVASRAQAFLQAIGDVVRPEAVLTWGITDKFTWVPIWFSRKDGLPNRPLPLDANYQPKPLMRVIKAFTSAKT